MVVGVTISGRVEERMEVEPLPPHRLAGRDLAGEGVGDLMTNGVPQAAVQ